MKKCLIPPISQFIKTWKDLELIEIGNKIPHKEQFAKLFIHFQSQNQH